MRKLNIKDIPLAINICDQMLREVDKNSEWSTAHVLMNPSAWSLLHKHLKMHEVYIITQGQGDLIVGNNALRVQAGNAVLISPRQQHKLSNTGVVSLEHLVLAIPPFDPTDVLLVDEQYEPFSGFAPYNLPPIQECFDGAKIIPYTFPEINTSIAFGWVINDPKRHKAAHYHKITREWAFIVEGNGFVEINGNNVPIAKGDWIQIEPEEFHAFRNNNDQYMVVVCICTPVFTMNDVYY